VYQVSQTTESTLLLRLSPIFNRYLPTLWLLTTTWGKV